MLDQPKEIRKGEEPDHLALEAYLKQQLQGFDRIEEIRQFPGGFSNLTYFIRTNIGEMVLRRPPFGANIKSAHDMSREFRVLSLLKEHYDKIPLPVLYCEEESVLGAPFYLMERVKGVILRNKVPEALDLSPDIMRRISEATVDNLVEMHAMDIFETGLIQLGKPEGYVERQVEGWIKRYYNAQTDEIRNMDDLAGWMRSYRPDDGAPSLIHNDYKYDNLVLDPSELSRIIAVLDWEMCTVGDPLMDLGTSLAYWMEAGEIRMIPNPVANLTWLPGNLDRQGIVERYAAKSGRDVSNILFYFVYGAFKIAVIIQQIYSRYKKGHTQDTRFAGLIELVKFFAHLGSRAVAKNRLSGLMQG